MYNGNLYLLVQIVYVMPPWKWLAVSGVCGEPHHHTYVNKPSGSNPQVGCEVK